MSQYAFASSEGGLSTPFGQKPTGSPEILWPRRLGINMNLRPVLGDYEGRVFHWTQLTVQQWNDLVAIAGGEGAAGAAGWIKAADAAVGSGSSERWGKYTCEFWMPTGEFAPFGRRNVRLEVRKMVRQGTAS